MKSEKVLRVNATKEHNRNSEGAFVELKDGTILFAYTRYIGEDWRDDASADIVVIKSKDCGTTWSEPEVVVEHDPGYGNVMSVSLLRLQSGRICFIYLKKHLFDGCTDCRPMLKVSDDDGATWSEPQYIIG
ncbi:MAG: exo-alpha-sialidase, partial [Lentisphaeria bacterium]|nr:exo-alpha-sialidase [Lentisphaeria bacterium]